MSSTLHPFRKLYGLDYDFPIREGNPGLSYFLAAIPRVGSTFLANKMWETGILGAPLEYLNIHDREDDITYFGSGDLFQYWESIRRRRTSPNGVFGAKLFTGDFLALFERQPGALGLLTADRVIQIRRKDKIAQAISYSRARKSKIWITNTDLRQTVDVDYEFEHIISSLRAIRRQEYSWDGIIQRTGAIATMVYYEDFEQSSDATIRDICGFLSVKPIGYARVMIPPVVKQRDDISDLWRDRFEKDLSVRFPGSGIDALELS